MPWAVFVADRVVRRVVVVQVVLWVVVVQVARRVVAVQGARRVVVVQGVLWEDPRGPRRDRAKASDPARSRIAL